MALWSLMPETFRVPIVGDRAQKFARLRQAAAQYGITIRGDVDKGEFSGMASGSYYVSDNIVTITITSRPFWIPIDTLEREFRKFLSRP